jgi:hypothetical protein
MKMYCTNGLPVRTTKGKLFYTPSLATKQRLCELDVSQLVEYNGNVMGIKLDDHFFLLATVDQKVAHELRSEQYRRLVRHFPIPNQTLVKGIRVDTLLEIRTRITADAEPLIKGEYVQTVFDVIYFNYQVPIYNIIVFFYTLIALCRDECQLANPERVAVVLVDIPYYQICQEKRVVRELLHIYFGIQSSTAVHYMEQFVKDMIHQRYKDVLAVKPVPTIPYLSLEEAYNGPAPEKDAYLGNKKPSKRCVECGKKANTIRTLQFRMGRPHYVRVCISCINKDRFSVNRVKNESV